MFVGCCVLLGCGLCNVRCVVFLLFVVLLVGVRGLLLVCVVRCLLLVLVAWHCSLFAVCGCLLFAVLFEVAVCRWS